MTHLAWQRTKQHCLLKRRCTRRGTLITFMLEQERLIWCFILVGLGILRRFLDKHWEKCDSQWSENCRSHPSVEWPFIVPLARNVILILGISHYQWEACQLASMNSPRSWSTPWRVSVHKRLQFYLLLFSPFEINKVCILLWYLNMWFPIRQIGFWPRPDRPGLCNLDHPMCCILLSVPFFSPDSMHQTLDYGLQCLGAISVSNGSSFGPGGYYRSTWQRPYPIKNRRFFKRTITLRPQILIREYSVWYVKYAALHGASFGRLWFSISLNLSKRQPKNLVFTPKMTIISKPLAVF